MPRFTPRPLQADPAASSAATTPPRPFHLPPLPPPVDLPASDTIVPLEPLDDLLALLPDGAPPHVDGAEALAPHAPTIARNRRVSMVQWSAGHLHLLQTTIRSRTKGEFNDNLLALLSDSPPGAVPLPTLATVTPPYYLIGPHQDDCGGDDVVGILQASISPTNPVIFSTVISSKLAAPPKAPVSPILVVRESVLISTVNIHRPRLNTN